MRTALKCLVITAAVVLLGAPSTIEAQLLCCAGPTQLHPNCNQCHTEPNGQSECLYEFSSASCACGWQIYFGENAGIGCHGVGNCDYVDWWQSECEYESGSDNDPPACWPWEPRSAWPRAHTARLLGGGRNLLTVGSS